MLTSLLLAVFLQFSSPVNYPVSLAGNFGEPRPHHFHGGIDVKTQQAVGKPIFSIGEGYVSRITIGISGFGNAVYVQHPNGYTSVYCHLKDFVPVLRAAVSRHRKASGQSDIIDEYKKPSPPADIILPPSEYPVSEGQLIAISGNTGSSQAPHLHLELHETKSWDMVDPLDFLRTPSKLIPSWGRVCSVNRLSSSGSPSTRIISTGLSRHGERWASVSGRTTIWRSRIINTVSVRRS